MGVASPQTPLWFISEKSSAALQPWKRLNYSSARQPGIGQRCGISGGLGRGCWSGDGGVWGKEDWTPDEGMSAIAGGEIIVDGVAKGKHEIDIGGERALDYLRLKREDPDLLFQKMAFMNVPRQ